MKKKIIKVMLLCLVLSLFCSPALANNDMGSSSSWTGEGGGSGIISYAAPWKPVV